MEEYRNSEFGNEVYHAWEVPEYERFLHSRLWYLIAALLLVSCIAYALFTSNPFFAIILVLIAIVYVVHELREPSLVQFGITDRGVVWHGFLFPYEEIKTFWIVYEPPQVKNLYLNFKRTTQPRLTIPLEDEDPLEILETLKNFVREDKRVDEPTIDSFGRILKI